MVGAHWADGHAGSVYVFRTTNGGDTYDQVDKPTPDDPAGATSSAAPVAIDGDTLVVGAGATTTTPFNRARVYVFQRPTAAPRTSEVAKLTADAADSNDNLGISVAIDGTTIVVGAYYRRRRRLRLGLGLRLPHEDDGDGCLRRGTSRWPS